MPPATTKGKESKWTAEQQKRGKEIKARQDALGLSLPQVTKLSGISQTTWSRLVNCQYPSRIDEQLNMAERHLTELEKSVARKSKKRVAFTWYDTLDYLGMQAAIEDAWDEATADDAERCGETLSVVDYVAPYGFGKSEMIGQLRKRFGGVEIKARDAWDKSSFEAYQSIAEQLGIKRPLRNGGKGTTEERSWRSKGEVENAILAKLKSEPMVLYFSEIELGNTSLCNLWKEISNETRCVVVRLSLPEFYCRMLKRLGEYAGQVNSRTQAVIIASRLDANDARRVFSSYAPRLSLDDKVAAQLAAFATELGGRRALKECAKQMETDSKVVECPTVLQVAEHMEAYRLAHQLRTRSVSGDLAGFVPAPRWPRLA